MPKPTAGLTAWESKSSHGTGPTYPQCELCPNADTWNVFNELFSSVPILVKRGPAILDQAHPENWERTVRERTGPQPMPPERGGTERVT